ncbi:MAG TPA: thermonuclease family protein [Pyrinomonadaceae bacterium]|nr:thermonuclease family protein [Pyrinomonadaceae bacterium]
MNKLIPILFILIGWTLVYAYQHRTQALAQTYQVVSTIDGDTIKVNLNGTIETVRLLGVDTPETVDPRKPVQCYGPEASQQTKELLTGKEVTLEADPSQDDRDKYGRLLRYVYLGNQNVSLLLITEGYGREYTYNKPYKYQKAFREAQDNAKANKRGLWGSCS